MFCGGKSDKPPPYSLASGGFNVACPAIVVIEFTSQRIQRGYKVLHERSSTPSAHFQGNKVDNAVGWF